MKKAHPLLLEFVVAATVAAAVAFHLNADRHEERTDIVAPQTRSNKATGTTSGADAGFVALVRDVKLEPARQDPWPMLGGGPGRNPVNLVDKNLAIDWSLATGKNVKWAAAVGAGSVFLGSAVVAGGKVLISGNNDPPRDARFKDHRPTLLAFNEADGKFLWQIGHDLPPNHIYDEIRQLGLFSTPTVVGERVFYVTPSCEVVCAALADGQILWRYDMFKDLHVVPLHASVTSPLVVDGQVFLVTGNGRLEDGKVVAPKAPSFIALRVADGKLVWQSSLPADKIIEGQWGSPSYAEVRGQGQVLFPGGDGWLYSLHPDTGALLWKFNGNRFADPKRPYYFLASPVIYQERAYFGMSLHPEHPMPTRAGHVWCVALDKRGDVSPVGTALNPNPKAKPHPASALVWHFGGLKDPAPANGRRAWLGNVVGLCAVHDGLAYVAEESGYLHCLDIKSGERCWEHDLQAGAWGSPYVAAGKVFIGSDDGMVTIFAHGRAKKILSTMDMEEAIQGSVCSANGVLYVRTRGNLYAIAPR